MEFSVVEQRLSGGKMKVRINEVVLHLLLLALLKLIHEHFQVMERFGVEYALEYKDYSKRMWISLIREVKVLRLFGVNFR